MIKQCIICGKSFKEDDEVRVTVDALWHELGSKIHYSITRPHHLLSNTLRHTECAENE
jgi:hypothetical protein